MTPLETVLSRLPVTNMKNGYWMAKCPAHEDRHASLSISEGADGAVLLNCHAGCSYEQIMAKLDLEPKDGFDRTDNEPEATYDYVDEQGNLLHQTVRFPGKQFRQRRPDDNGGWIWNLSGTRTVPYRLPEVLQGIKEGRGIFIVEGEKDADAIFRAGGIATCNPMGAGKWQAEHNQYFKGAKVRVVADKDDVGIKHARQVADALTGIADVVVLVEPKEGKDSADHLKLGHSIRDFVPMINSRFRPLDLSSPVPETDWLLEGWLAKGDMNFVSALWGIGKSWWTMGLAVAIADGHPQFLSHNLKAHGRVLIFDEENPRDIVLQRLKALGLQNHQNVRYIHDNGVRLDRSPEDVLGEVIDFRPELVVFDSFTRIHSKEENSVSEISPLLNDVLKPLARESNACLVVIHHPDKGGRGSRGSGDIEASADGVIFLYRDNENRPGHFYQKLTKSRRRLAGRGMTVQIRDLDLIHGGGTRLEVV